MECLSIVKLTKTRRERERGRRKERARKKEREREREREKTIVFSLREKTSKPPLDNTNCPTQVSKCVSGHGWGQFGYASLLTLCSATSLPLDQRAIIVVSVKCWLKRSANADPLPSLTLCPPGSHRQLSSVVCPQTLSLDTVDHRTSVQCIPVCGTYTSK